MLLLQTNWSRYCVKYKHYSKERRETRGTCQVCKMRPENSRYVSCISKEARELEVHVNLHQLASRKRGRLTVCINVRGGKGTRDTCEASDQRWETRETCNSSPRRSMTSMNV